jgi:hypothetical protein
MTWTVSDIIRLSCGLAGKDIEPRENILNAGVSFPRVNHRVKEVMQAKIYPVIRPHRATWDKMEVKNVSL